MRKRIIDPEYWSDEEIGGWSHSARLLYIGLWNFADDEGRFKAHPELIKSQVFPYDKRINIDKLLHELASKVQLYEVNGCQYGFLKNFSKHQRIDRPTLSRLPEPLEIIGSPKIEDDSTINRRSVPPNISKDNISKDNISKDNISKEKTIPALVEFLAYSKTLSIYHPSMDFQIEAKYNAWVDNDWKDGNNKPIKNWKTKMQNTMPYFKKENNNGNNTNKQSSRGADGIGGSHDYSKPPNSKYKYQ